MPGHLTVRCCNGATAQTVPAECLLLAHQWQQAHVSHRFCTRSQHACLQQAVNALFWVSIIGYCLFIWHFGPQPDGVNAAVNKSVWRTQTSSSGRDIRIIFIAVAVYSHGLKLSPLRFISSHSNYWYYIGRATYVAKG